MTRCCVLDYGSSNLRSVCRALQHAAEGKDHITLGRDAAALDQADRIVFPGQGAMGQCMRLLAEHGLDTLIRDIVRDRPFLGICLGLQALLEHSAEDGGTPGLGIIAGQVQRFPEPAAREADHKVPHIGWNRVRQTQPHRLWEGVADHSWFYFAHSYYPATDPAFSAGHTRYIVDYPSALARDNLFATQFHPEKSQHTGLRLLQNFLRWDGD